MSQAIVLAYADFCDLSGNGTEVAMLPDVMKMEFRTPAFVKCSKIRLSGYMDTMKEYSAILRHFVSLRNDSILKENFYFSISRHASTELSLAVRKETINS